MSKLHRLFSFLYYITAWMYHTHFYYNNSVTRKTIFTLVWAWSGNWNQVYHHISSLGFCVNRYTRTLNLRVMMNDLLLAVTRQLIVNSVWLEILSLVFFFTWSIFGKLVCRLFRWKGLVICEVDKKQKWYATWTSCSWWLVWKRHCIMPLVITEQGHDMLCSWHGWFPSNKKQAQASKWRSVTAVRLIAVQF